MSKPIIAIDADGVLLDYNLAYASAWERAFGVYPKERDPDAYWAVDRWDVDRLSGEPLNCFRAVFDEAFWASIPALDGAVQACHALRAGLKLTIPAISAIGIVRHHAGSAEWLRTFGV